ncbi:MAG: hypothetical protein H6712_19130 [Myxococcales bacterium]|nr:hypothetical protein [Myxococcales bacterium]
MTMRLRCILGVVLLPSIACKGGPDPDEPVRYVLRSKDLGLLGATITVEGVKATFEREHYNATEDVAKAMVAVPRSAPLVLGSLAVELSTPCGPESIALRAEDGDVAAEAKRREGGGAIQPMLVPAEALPASRSLWTDAKDGAVTVGKATLAHGGNRLHDLECSGGPATIAVDGEEIGPVPAVQDGRSEGGVFVAAAPSTCYRYSQVVYAKAGSGGGGFEQRLEGSQIHELVHPEIQYFLRSAGGSSSVEHTTYELLVVPCGE